jgi:hypothetical protein
MLNGPLMQSTRLSFTSFARAKMSSASEVPYCKTSAEAFAPGAVFPNGYRRVGDERSVDQKLLDLQDACFRRMDAMETAQAAQARTIAKFTADLQNERVAWEREIVVHSKAIAAIKSELAAERRAKDSAVSRLTAALKQTEAQQAAPQRRAEGLSASHRSLRSARRPSARSRRCHGSALAVWRAAET